jgi:hypothetical protein
MCHVKSLILFDPFLSPEGTSNPSPQFIRG